VLDTWSVNGSDYARRREFCEKASAPLRMPLLMEPIGGTRGFGRDGKPLFWITNQRQPTTENVFVAFTAPGRAKVDAFHPAALEAGGSGTGGPGIRGIYHPSYYGALVLDLDGNNLAAVCHRPE
jgi:hypothetical protein